MCPPPSISPLHSTFCLLPHHPLEFKQQRICPLSLGFGTLGRNPSSAPRQKTVATRLSSPCLSFSGTLPCPAPCCSFRLRDFSRKLLQDELEGSLVICSALELPTGAWPDLHRKKMHLVFDLMSSPPLHSQKPPREHRTGKQVPMPAISTHAPPSQQVHIAIHLLSCHPLFHLRHASHACPAKL